MIETQRLVDWHRFGADAIGLHVDELTRDAMRFRLDDHECRLLLQRGPAEDVIAVGWQIDDHETFDEVVARIRRPRRRRRAGHTTRRPRCAACERLVALPGPEGRPTEDLYTTPVTTTAPLHMQASGFVTGDAGMGHIAITSRQPERSTATTTTCSTRRLSDFIIETDQPACASGSGSCGSTAATTPSPWPTSRACASTRSAPRSSTSTSRSPRSTT